MDRVEDFILGGYNRTNYPSRFNFAYESPLNLSKNTMFGHYLRADISYDKEFEIPLVMKECLEYIYRMNPKPSEICLPLFTNESGYIRTRRLVGNMLRDFQDTTWNARMRCVKNNNGEMYYGGDGFILNRNHELLYISTAVFHYDQRLNKFVYDRCRCHIHYRVFANQEGMVEKTIYKKFIPLCSQQGPRMVQVNHAQYSVDKKMEVVIDDCDHFLAKPHLPSPSTADNEHFNDLIAAHINDCYKYDEY